MPGGCEGVPGVGGLVQCCEWCPMCEPGTPSIQGSTPPQQLWTTNQGRRHEQSVRQKGLGLSTTLLAVSDTRGGSTGFRVGERQTLPVPFETRGPSFVSKVPPCVEHVSQHKCVTYQGHTHGGATITGLPAPGLGPESLFSPLQTGQSQGSHLGSVPRSLPMEVKSTGHTGHPILAQLLTL